MNVNEWFERIIAEFDNQTKFKLKTKFILQREAIRERYNAVKGDEKTLELLGSIVTQIEGVAKGPIFIDYDFDIINNKNSTAFKTIFIEESKKMQRIIFDIYKDNSKLQTLNCWEFEEMIAELLSKQGYKIELTSKTKDNGYDIIAIMEAKMHNPLKFLVECKRYTQRKVGVEIIRGFKEVIATEGANKGFIVTTSYFTKGALEKQREIPYLLDYRDKDKVIEWVKDYFSTSSL